MYLHTIFFPSGKVHQRYIQYVGWSFLSNVTISVESAVATHSMLHSMDTGTDTIRTINYIGKDIIGQIGGIIYMVNMGKEADKHPHRFLLYSNILQQTSYILLSTTPMIPGYFLPVAGTSNILCNISFTGFGAVNAKCIQKLSIDNNTGEIYAKVAVFNTLGSSIGLLIGLGIISAIPDHSTRLCIIPFLVAGRIYTFNRAIKNLL
jgi:Vitamin B6 photo-protection and homoeostasis